MSFWTLLLIVVALAVHAVTFIAGIVCALMTIARDEPYLFGKWYKNRKNGVYKK